MARKPDTECAGGCGVLLWSGRGCLPAGRRTCRDCRRKQRDARLECSRQAADERRAQRRPQPSAHGRRAPRVCLVCNATYRPTDPAQRTCSRACGVAMRAAVLRSVVCRECDTEFSVRTGGYLRRRCEACSAPAPRMRTCRHCAAVYPANAAGARVKYCSLVCAATAHRARDLVRYGTTPERVDQCRRCGGKVALRRRACDLCLRESIAAARRRRKARLRNAQSEPYTLTEIAVRDRRMCGLCRKRVAMLKSVPHPKAPTIDHIVPLADGGDDLRANVQLAHFMCNSRKSAGGMQQLALVG